VQNNELARFRAAYWRALYSLDRVRLRQWEKSHVTLPQLRVLYQVRRTPGITTGELSRALGVTVSTTSGLVIKLVEKGMLQRTTTPEDRRQAPLFLTDAAQALVGEFSEAGRSYLNAVAAELGAEQVGAVTAALERLAEAAGTVTDGDGDDDLTGEVVTAPAVAAGEPETDGGRTIQRAAREVTP
jgi:DNA-binding MarR family transcriptional regulator